MAAKVCSSQPATARLCTISNFSFVIVEVISCLSRVSKLYKMCIRCRTLTLRRMKTLAYFQINLRDPAFATLVTLAPAANIFFTES